MSEICTDHSECEGVPCHYLCRFCGSNDIGLVDDGNTHGPRAGSAHMECFSCERSL